MGELLLCHETIAALPYYIEEIGINIYSMEELSYYISGNVYLLIIPSCARVYVHGWKNRCIVSNSHKNSGRISAQKEKLSDFVFCRIAGYGILYHERNAGDRFFAVRQMEQKSDFECDKIRADQLMEKEKYLAAIYRYKHLLDEADTKETGEVLRGNIWHNLGTAYARLLFEEAGRCFEKAYAFNKQKESLRECLMLPLQA